MLGLWLSPPQPASAQVNLSFESAGTGALPAGWSWFGPEPAPDTVRVQVDSATAAHGARSLTVAQSEADALTRIGQNVAAAAWRPHGTDAGTAARRVRVRGVVSGAPGTGPPGIWLRIAGGKGALYLDSRGATSGPDGAAGSATAYWQRVELELPLPADAQEVRFGLIARGAGVASFDDFSVEVVAADGRPPALPAARRYLDTALAILEDNSIYRARIDWPALRAAAAGHARGAATPADAHLALRYAIYELADRHSYLRSPETTEQLRQAPLSSARTGRAPIEPRAERAGERLGYLALPSFVGGPPQSQVQFATRVQALIKELDTPGTCGWILDLRRNGGGDLWPMLVGVGPLLGDGEVGASVYPDGRRVPVWYRDGRGGFGDYVQLRVVEPYRLAAGAPVAILIGPATASAAEMLTVAFRGRDAAASFGAATAGLTTGNKTFPLSDGSALILTVAAASDRAGRTYPGPIEPEHGVETAREGGDAVRAAAAAWLESSRECAGPAPAG